MQHIINFVHQHPKTHSMKRTILSFCTTFLLFSGLLAQNYTISGYITDSKNGETLISASVYEEKSLKGTVSNTYGFYSLTIPKGDVTLRFSYVGYSSQTKKFKLDRDTVINISMLEGKELNEVTVIGNQKEIGVRGTQMSAIEVPISQIKSIPTLFGETDVLKALQLLPGVQAGVEGSAGFYVRGGGPDENLFLLDGVPVYNVNHLGGFFSVFNADALKNVTLYKGAFPARFGGRLSSVVDLQMKDGNPYRLHGDVTIGLISSKFNLEGPLFNRKTTFNFSGRRTYFDILSQPFIKMAAKQSGEINKISAGYYFYDLNAKISHKFSDNDRLFLSVYSGDDAIYSDIQDSYVDYDNGKQSSNLKMDWKWGNFITAAKWNHVINNKLFMNTTATYTQYRFHMAVGTEFTAQTYDPPSKVTESITLGYKSGITDYSAKVDFDYAPSPNHDIKFGLNYTNHTFRPGVTVSELKLDTDTLDQRMDTTIGDQSIFANETSLYFEDNININNYLKANVGLHYSTFIVQNQFYHSLQPRVNLRLLLSDNLSLKASYVLMNQYIHLLSNNNVSLPTDLWVPVTKRIAPMKSDQVSFGAFYNLLNIVDLSFEAYYKSMDNLIEYKDGASFWGSNTGWEDKVSLGRGWAYGAEFMAQKSIGKTTGWVAYSWAKSERLFDRPGQELNNGLVFPAKYDRRHNISVVLSHKFNEKIDISGTWVFNTGNNGTIPMQNTYSYPVPGTQYNYDNSIPYINQRNNFKYPNYHRLDLGVNFNKQLKHGKRIWNISFYNLYNHMNPFLVYVGTDYNFNYLTGQMTTRKSLKQITIFPVIPSVSYSYKF